MDGQEFKNNNGFSAIGLIILLAAGLLAGVYYFSQNNEAHMVSNVPEAQHSPYQEALRDGNNDCQSPPTFTHHFTDIDTILSIIPPVFRNSHGTMATMLINIEGTAPLYMPIDGKITEGSYHLEEGTEFYMWHVDVGCGLTVVFDHVTEPVDEIRELFPDKPNEHTRTDIFDQPLEMNAGELVGYTTGSTNAHNWNFAVYDANTKNYLWETGEFNDRPKYYTQVCPFDYYDESITKEYESLFLMNFNDITVEENICQN